jgi:hypothetical protein
MATQLRIKRRTADTTAPTSLTAGEMAINLVDKKLYVGGTAGTNVIFLDSTSSVGLGTANTFTQLNTFSAGISAAGATFTGSISGATATFSKDITVNSVTVGLGGGQSISNTAVGNLALSINSGTNNTGVGNSALAQSTGNNNTGVGYNVLASNASGSNNTIVGGGALVSSIAISNNTAVGAHSLSDHTTGSNKTAIGYGAGRYKGTGESLLQTGTGGIYIGYQARGSTASQTNEIVIGVDALGLGSNTTVIGATLQSAATIYGVLNLPSGLSASGATFTGNVTAQSTLYTDNIQAIGTQINIANAASGRVAFGDYDGAGNSTFVFIRDATSALLISNPYGDIGIGDPNNVDSGYRLTYNAAAGYLDGGNSALTNFNSGSFGGLLTASVGISAAGATFSGPIISTGYQISSGAINAQTASYSLVAGDNGKIVTMNVGAGNTLTVPASLAVGFNCTVIQLGAGQTTIVASGTTLNSYQGYLKISGQHGSASIVGYTSNVYNVAGNLSA